jgi:hypothetical protein
MPVALVDEHVALDDEPLDELTRPQEREVGHQPRSGGGPRSLVTIAIVPTHVWARSGFSLTEDGHLGAVDDPGRTRRPEVVSWLPSRRR